MQYSPGQLVRHPTLGLGKVLSVDGDKVTAFFMDDVAKNPKVISTSLVALEVVENLDDSCLQVSTQLEANFQKKSIFEREDAGIPSTQVTFKDGPLKGKKFKFCELNRNQIDTELKKLLEAELRRESIRNSNAEIHDHTQEVPHEQRTVWHRGISKQYGIRELDDE